MCAGKPCTLSPPGAKVLDARGPGATAARRQPFGVVALPWVALAGKRRWGAAAGIQKDWEKDLESVDLHLVRRLVRHLHLHLHRLFRARAPVALPRFSAVSKLVDTGT